MVLKSNHCYQRID